MARPPSGEGCGEAEGGEVGERRGTKWVGVEAATIGETDTGLVRGALTQGLQELSLMGLYGRGLPP